MHLHRQRYFARTHVPLTMTTSERSGLALDEDVLDRVRGVLEDHPVSFAMVFGSAARDGVERANDLDLAVEFGEVRPTDDGYSEVYLGLLSDLHDALAHEVDVVDVHALTPQFARAVFDSGVVIIGTQGTKEVLEQDLATGTLSVDEARDRVSVAVARLKEGS